MNTAITLAENRRSYPGTFFFKEFLKKRIVLHLLFWTTLYLLNTLYVGFLLKDYPYAFYSYTVKMPFLIAVCYLNIYWLFPKFLSQKKYVSYFAGLAVIMTALTVLMQIMLNFLVYADFCPEQYVKYALFSPENTLDKLFSIFTVVALTSGIKLTKDWVVQQQRIKDIEKQNLKNELEFLKSQIQPHFFFNTLNNLYSLTVQKSDQAGEVVLKLSDLLSYMLYESGEEFTTVEKEMAHVSNYLDLEKLRFGNRLHLNFEINGNMEQKKIPPLLLLPFIENSFKHGTSNEIGEIKIDLQLHADDEQIMFKVTNLKNGNVLKPKQRNGLGLKNVRRRLDLLYGENYSLAIEENEQQYSVSLTIPCS